MGVARWGVCPQGLKPPFLGPFYGTADPSTPLPSTSLRAGRAWFDCGALTKVTPNLLAHSANLIRSTAARQARLEPSRRALTWMQVRPMMLAQELFSFSWLARQFRITAS